MPRAVLRGTSSSKVHIHGDNICARILRPPSYLISIYIYGGVFYYIMFFYMNARIPSINLSPSISPSPAFSSPSHSSPDPPHSPHCCPRCVRCWWGS